MFSCIVILLMPEKTFQDTPPFGGVTTLMAFVEKGLVGKAAMNHAVNDSPVGKTAQITVVYKKVDFQLAAVITVG